MFTGSAYKTEARKLHRSLVGTLKHARFELSNWTRSNLQYRKASEDLIFLDVDQRIKTLDETWTPSCDVFSFFISQFMEDLGVNLDYRTQHTQWFCEDFRSTGVVISGQGKVEAIDAANLVSQDSLVWTTAEFLGD